MRADVGGADVGGAKARNATLPPPLPDIKTLIAWHASLCPLTKLAQCARFAASPGIENERDTSIRVNQDHAFSVTGHGVKTARLA